MSYKTKKEHIYIFPYLEDWLELPYDINNETFGQLFEKDPIKVGEDIIKTVFISLNNKTKENFSISNFKIRILGVSDRNKKLNHISFVL